MQRHRIADQRRIGGGNDGKIRSDRGKIRSADCDRQIGLARKSLCGLELPL